MSNAKQCDCCRKLYTRETDIIIKAERHFAIYTDNTKNKHEVMLDLCPDCQSRIEDILGVPGEFKSSFVEAILDEEAGSDAVQ